jgi:hypothetical protein
MICLIEKRALSRKFRYQKVKAGYRAVKELSPLAPHLRRKNLPYRTIADILNNPSSHQASIYSSPERTILAYAAPGNY